MIVLRTRWRVMSILRLFGRTGGAAANEPEAEPFVERRGEPREAVFQEVVLTLEDYHKIRAVIVNLSARGARIQFSTRTELPFRVRLSAPTLKLSCWARVVWQHDDAAGLQFLLGEGGAANG
jgi:hypothetical protein